MVMKTMTILPEEKNTHNQSSNHFLKDIVIPVGAVLIAGITLLSAKHKIPIWASICVVLYFVVVMVVVVAKPSIQLISLFKNKLKKKHLAKIFYPQLADTASKFGPLIEHQRSNTICYLIEDINRWDEVRNQQIQYDAEHMGTINGWFVSIKNYLNFYRFKDFPILAKGFSSLINQYNRFCIKLQRQLEAIVSSGKLSEQRLRDLKREWNVHREKHNKIIQNWEDRAKDINKVADDRICIDYYEPLKTLE